MKNKKLIASAALPIVVIVAYIIIFHVDPFEILLLLPWYFVPSFFLAYFVSNAIAAVRDSMIAEVSYGTALKARLLGNAVSLIIPGALGPDLSRALVYVNRGVKIEDALVYSFIIAFYDVVIGSFLFLAVLFVRPELLSFFYVLIAFGNILYWLLIMGYIAGTAGSKMNKLEDYIFKKLQEYPEISKAYQRAKQVTRDKMNSKLTSFSAIITILEYAVQALPFYFVFHSYLYSLYLNQLYFVSLLIPIPAGAVSSELALTSVLPPLYAIGIRVLELFAYSLGFVFIKEVNLTRLQEEIRRYGKVPQRAQSGGAEGADKRADHEG